MKFFAELIQRNSKRILLSFYTKNTSPFVPLTIMLYPSAEYLFGSSALVQAAAVAAAFDHEGEFLKAAKRPHFVHQRKCISVHDVFLSMGPRLFRRVAGGADENC
jgi:hypothetical protein